MIPLTRLAAEMPDKETFESAIAPEKSRELRNCTLRGPGGLSQVL